MKEEKQNIDFILYKEIGQIHQATTERREGRTEQGFGFRKDGKRPPDIAEGK